MAVQPCTLAQQNVKQISPRLTVRPNRDIVRVEEIGCMIALAYKPICSERPAWIELNDRRSKSPDDAVLKLN
jgi:hypothetical protein